MSYNRDWDKGKDQWGDSSAWGDTSSRGNVRGRDEEYYGEGKRRKYNDGGYGAAHSYEENANEGGWGHGHQGDSGQDYAYDDRSQKGSHAKKRLVPSEPSPHVIFLGLDPDFTEADLQAYLVNQGFSVESVTIIRERSTGVSKGFGFAQFTSIDHARAFVDPLFPFIQIPPPASHGASATAAFYKAVESGGQHTGRRVKIDYSQSANPSEKGRRGPLQSNDGTRDIGNAQAPLLLFRGLDLLSGPQAIAQAMKTSAGPGKDGAKGMKRITLIKDRVTMASWGFAFVEFVDVQSAAAVLAASMSPQIHPNGFRISDRPVATSFAHPYSFQGVDPMRRDEAAIPSSVTLGGAEGAWVRYWDEASSVAVLDFKVDEPPKPTVPTKEKKEKKKAKELVAGIVPLEPSILPISDKPVTLSFKTNATTKTGAPLALGFSMTEDRAGDGSDDDGANEADGSNPKVAAAKKVPPMITSKKTFNNINKWNQVQEELSHNVSTNQAPVSIVTSAQPQAVETPPVVVAPAKAKATSPVPQETEFEFSDTVKMTCLLCARQFKTMDQLKRHNKESDLHKVCNSFRHPKNFKDVSLRDVAREKANVARQAASSSTSSGAVASEHKYRDRAAERRIMHNQPEAPMPEPTQSHSKKRFAEGPPPVRAVTPPAPPVNPGQDETNVGNRLLKMMGWKEGTGLGSSGDGRVDPIQTAVFEQGVGLGASKGKEITNFTEGYTGYVHMARDAARERYGS
ncbi:hypothetical protein JAAARDRAFT_56428 [Jaapia argillacea MUCL 33604]|uniref:G-patch domain-containing protein n=1 Tax=Jaapia argillacea MUCL 33604 TaxID=933084 RepID=A0A067PXH3_9AGAM|nr:hypothetical protein JAAARDRAFT_56428 [Jaapia argillacea MUCL 33604]